MAEETKVTTYKVSSNPHVRSKATTGGIMLLVIIALLPATGFGIYNFGLRAVFVIAISIASAVLSEFLEAMVFQHVEVLQPASEGSEK